MDRYKFEGYISDYIENSLSISKRKEFEQYLSENPEANEKVEAVRKTIQSLNNLSEVKTSKAFMDNLQGRIAQQNVVVSTEQQNLKPLIFGFKPITATMMSLVILAIIFVGFELLPNNPSAQTPIPTQMTTNSTLQNTNTESPVTNFNSESDVAESTVEDSLLNADELPQNRPDFDDRINYVKTQ
jgi:hypothetical protein